MRLVVGTEGSREFRQAERDRHLDAMARFVERATGDSGAPQCCTMVLRAANSAPAQALIAMKDALADAGVQATAILATLTPEDDLKALFASLAALSPDAPAAALIRWARNPRLLDAHEQATYGTDMCWSGDAMRRDADKRNPLVLFDTDAPGAARLAHLAFKALWGASVPVPARHLVAGGPAKPSGAYEQQDGAPVTALRPHLQGWPLVRH
jgi:surface antigen